MDFAMTGEIIALLNKHNVAPLVFTKEIDEDFFDSFEGAQIVDYIIKHKYNNITNVVKRLEQLQSNKNTTVLVVNDSHIYGSYLKQNLVLHSFKVLSAANNEEAYEKLDLHPEISLVVLDENKPYVNAMELVRKIRQLKQTKELKILYISSESNSFETSSLLSAGADDFIIKPFSRHEFYLRVYQNIKKVC